MDLWGAMYEDLVDDSLSEQQVAVARTLQQLTNRQSYVPIHTGSYSIDQRGDSVFLRAGDMAICMDLTGAVGFEPQDAQVTFYLTAGGERIQRMALIRLPSGNVMAWVGGNSPPAASIFDIFGALQASEDAEAYVEARLGGLQKIFGKRFALAMSQGTNAARTLFLDWLAHMGGMYESLTRLSDALGFATPPRATFSRLMRTFLTEDQFRLLVGRSIAFGIGYNVGALARGEARDLLLQGGNFKDDIDLAYAVRNKAGFDLQLFYIVDLADGRQLPRYYI
jgi:hypothetical protein